MSTIAHPLAFCACVCVCVLMCMCMLERVSLPLPGGPARPNNNLTNDNRRRNDKRTKGSSRSSYGPNEKAPDKKSGACHEWAGEILPSRMLFGRYDRPTVGGLRASRSPQGGQLFLSWREMCAKSSFGTILPPRATAKARSMRPIGPGCLRGPTINAST